MPKFSHMFPNAIGGDVYDEKIGHLCYSNISSPCTQCRNLTHFDDYVTYLCSTECMTKFYAAVAPSRDAEETE